MVFDGNTQKTCPNYDIINNKLENDWDDWLKEYNNPDRDGSFQSENFQKKCFNICGEGKYINNGICNKCPIDFYKEDSQGREINPKYRSSSYIYMCDYNNLQSQNVRGASCERILEDTCKNVRRKTLECAPCAAENFEAITEAGCTNDLIADWCAGISLNKKPILPIWFKSQKEENLKHERIDQIDWNNQSETSPSSVLNFWKNEENRVTDEYLGQLIGERIPGSMNYKLPNEFMTNGKANYKLLRKKINTNRGSIVKCPKNKEIEFPHIFKCYDPIKNEYTEGKGFFGPDQLVFEEVHDYWISEYGGIETKV